MRTPPPPARILHDHAADVSLDPAQEDVVRLDLDTPAILLTAGAGTGKTHTLAARLARILGVETHRTPAELSVNQSAVLLAGVGAEVERQLDRPHAVGEGGVRQGGEGGGGSGGWDRRVGAAHAAAPESVLVLSFTTQVRRGELCLTKQEGAPFYAVWSRHVGTRG